MDKITLFTAVTTAAVVLQAVVLVAIFISLRKTGGRVETLAAEVRGRALPAINTAQAIMDDSRDKLDAILTNAQTTSSLVRGQVERLDATVGDVIDRARVHVIRADEMVTQTLNRVEEARQTVNTVASPVRQISGIVQGVSVGLDAFFRRGKRRRSGNGMNV